VAATPLVRARIVEFEISRQEPTPAVYVPLTVNGASADRAVRLMLSLALAEVTARESVRSLSAPRSTSFTSEIGREGRGRATMLLPALTRYKLRHR